MSFPNDEIDMANSSFVYRLGLVPRLINDGRDEAEARQTTKEYITMMREEYLFEKETEEFEASESIPCCIASSWYSRPQEFVTKAIEEGTAKEGQNCEDEKAE